jgi:hypothetical protein
MKERTVVLADQAEPDMPVPDPIAERAACKPSFGLA